MYQCPWRANEIVSVNSFVTDGYKYFIFIKSLKNFTCQT